MVKHVKNLYSRLRIQVGGEKGISTVEWIGLTAVVLVFLSAIFAYVQLHGGQVGAAAGSSMDEQNTLWMEGGGRVSSYGDPGSIGIEDPGFGAAPGLSPPDAEAGEVLGDSDEGDEAEPGGGDDQRRWIPPWSRFGPIAGPIYAAETTPPEETPRGRPSPWDGFWGSVRGWLCDNFGLLCPAGDSSPPPEDEQQPDSNRCDGRPEVAFPSCAEITDDTRDEWLETFNVKTGDCRDVCYKEECFYHECVTLAKELADWIANKGSIGRAGNYYTRYHGEMCELNEYAGRVERGDALVWPATDPATDKEGDPLRDGHIAIVLGGCDGKLWVVEQNWPRGSCVKVRELSYFDGIYWWPKP